MPDPQSDFPRPDRSAGEAAAKAYLEKQTFSDDLIDIYHRYYLNLGDHSEDQFEPVTRNSEPRVQNNIQILRNKILSTHRDILPGNQEEPGTEPANYRVASLSAHVARIHNERAEAWEDPRCEIYSLAVFIEGFQERRGHYLVTDNGLERFESPVAHFVLAAGSGEVDFQEGLALEQFGEQAVLTKNAFDESRQRLRPIEQKQSSIIQDKIVSMLLEQLGLDVTDKEAVLEVFETSHCSKSDYRISYEGKEYPLDIRLHSRQQNVIVVPPVELLAALRNLS